RRVARMGCAGRVSSRRSRPAHDGRRRRGDLGALVATALRLLASMARLCGGSPVDGERRAKGDDLRYDVTLMDSPFGSVVVATTSDGVHAVEFVDSDRRE